jgi:DNA-binding Lrp family transcriptional regulator
MADMAVEESVTVREAAARLHIHPSTLRNNIRAGKVRGVIRRYGAAIEIDARALAAMVKARESDAERQP